MINVTTSSWVVFKIKINILVKIFSPDTDVLCY